jgi:Fe-S-cluster containining protein
MSWKNGWRERAIAQVEFKCDRCGRCCTRPEVIDVLVEDVYRLGRHFHTRFTQTVEKFAVPHRDNPRRMMFKNSHPCMFYQSICKIYSSRPMVCRMAPFLAAPIPNHNIELIGGKEYTDDEIFEGLMSSSGLTRHEVVRWLRYIGAWEDGNNDWHEQTG